jgi:16S rRNA (guanine1516-N2)-methyltransferase
MYVILSTPNFHNQAQQLALQLQLPLHTEKSKGSLFYLYYNDDGLNLIATHLNLGPLHLDFNHGVLYQRIQRAAISKEPLARAVGLHKNPNLHLCDATAGIGREGCLLASLGARVTLIERSLIMVALLNDALNRCDAVWRERVNLIAADSRDFLATTKEQFDVIYLDPMFEAHSHKAQVKKEMQYLQALMGPQEDADTLLTAALSLKPGRVVVKRPLKARCLLDKKPDFCLNLEAYRFDIYLG